jgi:hypothetical protein
MNWNLALQFVGYAFLISVYAVFAWTGRVPVEGFIVILTGALATLGSAHVSASSARNAAKAATDAAIAANPPTPPAAPTVVEKQ